MGNTMCFRANKGLYKIAMLFYSEADLFLCCLHVLMVWLIYELRHEKTNVLVSDLVRHKPGCTATEDGYRLEFSDLESKEIALSILRKQRR